MRKAAALAAALLLVPTLAVNAYAESIGTVETLLSQPGSQHESTSLGRVTSDAVRDGCGTDFAVIPGSLLRQNLQAGSVDTQTLEQVYWQDAQLAVCTVTPAELKELLECSVSHIVLNEAETLDEDQSDDESFLQISGFDLSYDASAPVGERVLLVTAWDGAELDLTDAETEYTIASVSGVFDGAYDGFLLRPEAESASYTLLECVAAAIAAGTATDTHADRMTVIGARQNQLIAHISPVIPAIAVGTILLLAAAGRLGQKQRKKTRSKKKERRDSGL